MTKAEVEILNLKGLTAGMDVKVDKLLLDVAHSQILSLVVGVLSPVVVGLIVYIVTK
jgi:hypothetical protein